MSRGQDRFPDPTPSAFCPTTQSVSGNSWVNGLESCADIIESFLRLYRRQFCTVLLIFSKQRGEIAVVGPRNSGRFDHQQILIVRLCVLGEVIAASDDHLVVDDHYLVVHEIGLSILLKAWEGSA